MAQTKAIIFDIDKTLSEDTSWLSLTRELGGSADEHLRIYEDYKNGLIKYDGAVHALLSLWRATGNANKPFFRQVFENLPLAPGAQEAVSHAKSQARVCLITGSMDLYAETVAQKLAVDEWYANTTLHWDDHGVLHGMDYELNQAKRKLEQLTEFCKKHAISPEECIIFGDSDNDILLFEATKRGVAVGNDVPEELKAVAWKMIGSVSELPTVLSKESI